MAYVVAFIVLASVLDLIGLTAVMWAVAKDLAHHDTRIFRLELVEKTLTERIEGLQAVAKQQAEEIARLNAWLDDILHREGAHP